MKHQINQTIYNFSNAYCELKGLSLCFEAYADNFAGEEVTEGGIGLNSNSGYIYIALECGITICSMLGRSVEYLVNDFETGEEHFFDTKEEAEEKINEINA